jgi:hypothetical protein
MLNNENRKKNQFKKKLPKWKKNSNQKNEGSNLIGKKNFMEDDIVKKYQIKKLSQIKK